MLEWCLVHPYLTFLIAIIGMIVIDNIIANICRVILNKKEENKDGDND